MLADNELRPSQGNAKQKTRCTDVAVGNPQIVFFDGRQHLYQQASLLGVGVFAGKDVGHQHPIRFQDHQRQPRQGTAAEGPQFLDAVLARRQVVPVEDFSPVARQQSTMASSQPIRYFGHPQCRLAHHLPGNLSFHAVELVIDRLHGYRKPLLLGEVRVVDRFANPRSHQGQQVYHRGKQQFRATLAFRCLGKDFVQQLRRDSVFQGSPKHHRHRTLLDKPIDNFTEYHCATPLRNAVKLKSSNTLSTSSQTPATMPAMTA